MQVLQWLDDMSSTAGFGVQMLHRMTQANSVIPSTRCRFDLEKLLLCLKLCLKLSGDVHLKSVLSDAGTIIGMDHGWLDSCSTVPSSHTLRRWRFRFDGALCLLQRDFFKKMPANGNLWGTAFTVWLLADSSPRVGKEWLLAEIFS